jgi:hypothetical protein
MKNLIRSAIGLGVVLCLGASASAQVCVPTPPKDTTGHVQVLHQGPSAAISHFEQNGCDWAGADQLNGTDGVVLDVTGQTGTAGVTSILGEAGLLGVVIQGRFLDEGCAPISGGDWHVSSSVASQPLTELVTIPAGAKWMLVENTNANVGNDLNITVHTDGADCPKPKKKKKKR